MKVSNEDNDEISSKVRASTDQSSLSTSAISEEFNYFAILTDEKSNDDVLPTPVVEEIDHPFVCFCFCIFFKFDL